MMTTFQLAITIEAANPKEAYAKLASLMRTGEETIPVVAWTSETYLTNEDHEHSFPGEGENDEEHNTSDLLEN